MNITGLMAVPFRIQILPLDPLRLASLDVLDGSMTVSSYVILEIAIRCADVGSAGALFRQELFVATIIKLQNPLTWRRYLIVAD